MMQNRTSIGTKSLIQGFFNLYPGEAARLLNRFPTKDILNYLQNETIATAAEIYIRLNPEIAAGLIEKMDDDFFTGLFTLIDPSMAARLLARLDDEVVTTHLSLLSSALTREIKELLEYPPETAGFLMDTNFSSYQPQDTVDQVLERIRGIRDRRVININVIDDDGILLGVVPLQEVAVAPEDETLADLIRTKPAAIQAMSPREEVVQLLDEQKLLSIPVVDFQGRMVGIIRYDALVKAAKQDATEDVQAMFGAGRDEQALSKVSFAVRKRLPWLEINLATAFLAAAVVGIFEETIARITVLAVFLPVVAGQSGNTGSQALAVTMRGLALREIRTHHWFRVARKEMLVGFLNGCAVAFTTSLIVFFLIKSIGLAVVIAVAMVVSMVIAGLSGAVIPILLKAFGQDPAQSSSIILTTVTDVVGFLSFLGLATALSGMLNIA
jgi:magnesium transporter